MGGGPYRQDCIGPNFHNMLAELLVAAGDDTIELYPPAKLVPYKACWHPSWIYNCGLRR